MTQHRVAIDPKDTAAWKQWCDCWKAMVAELRGLANPSVDAILDRYECRPCDYGMGMNIDWPDGEGPK